MLTPSEILKLAIKSPVAVKGRRHGSRAAPVALVDDDQVEEVGRVLAVNGVTRGVAGERLIEREVDFATLLHDAVLDPPAGVAEGSEVLVLRIVHEDFTIREIEDARFSRGTGAVPARLPQPPADLKGHERLARARGHRYQDAALARENRADTAIDGDLLVVAGRLARYREARLEKALRRSFVRRPMRGAKTPPQVRRARERIKFTLDTRREVELHDSFTVRGVGERQPESLGVFPGLLETVTGRFVVGLCLDDGDRKISRVAQEVVGALPALACR